MWSWELNPWHVRNAGSQAPPRPAELEPTFITRSSGDLIKSEKDSSMALVLKCVWIFGSCRELKTNTDVWALPQRFLLNWHWVQPGYRDLQKPPADSVVQQDLKSPL